MNKIKQTFNKNHTENSFWASSNRNAINVIIKKQRENKDWHDVIKTINKRGERDREKRENINLCVLYLNVNRITSIWDDFSILRSFSIIEFENGSLNVWAYAKN